MSILNNLHAWSASVARGGRGLVVRPYNQQNPPRPEQLLELYDKEGCPFCRKVREAMSELDLEYICRPATVGDTVKRPVLRELGGKVMVPFLVDPNTGAQMYESEDIIDYLARTYGNGRVPLSRALSPFNTLGSRIATGIRRRGLRVRPGREGREQPEELLVLYNFEASPYCRKVRETLSELNLDYRVRNVAKRSARRPDLVAFGGRMRVPFLYDPNTDTQLYESDDIIAYLERTY